MQAIDLTQRPPRSPRVRLGGYVILPRMLDKGRATINNKAGEYHFNCPLDQRFLDVCRHQGGAAEEAAGARQGRRRNARLDRGQRQIQAVARRNRRVVGV